MIKHISLDENEINNTSKASIEDTCLSLPWVMGNFFDVAVNESYFDQSTVDLAMTLYSKNNGVDIRDLELKRPLFEEGVKQVLRWRFSYTEDISDYYKKQFPWDSFSEFVKFLQNIP